MRNKLINKGKRNVFILIECRMCIGDLKWVRKDFFLGYINVIG